MGASHANSHAHAAGTPTPVAEPHFAGTPRFQITRRLGAGAMGVVYEALDQEYNVRVALKTLLRVAPERILRFKNEFRALQDVQHPNLVSLGELLEERGRWFFTMELVNGVDFLSYVRPGAGEVAAPPVGDDQATRQMPVHAVDATAPLIDPGPAAASFQAQYDEERLRAALAQVAQGLCALHEARKVHRDVKASNILVTEAGRVVILDFGIVSDELRPSLEAERQVVGTASFMAPEQAAGRAVGPAADWYAFGVLLYGALTGKLPFNGTPEEIVDLKQRMRPLPPSVLVPAVPRDLDELCLELLAVKAADRPTGREVLRRLNVIPAAPTALTTRSPFVGRQTELAELQSAFAEMTAGNTISVFVQGESGLGKSALVREFVSSLTATSAVVLSGRCYERESVPYKAVDEIIDRLSRVLAKLPKEEAAEIIPPDIELVAEVFPVLQQVEAIKRAVVNDNADLHPQKMRARVFAVLRELFVRFGARHDLVVVIDDLQWSDTDSLALLADVLRAPGAPRLLLLATIRTGSDVTGLHTTAALAETLAGDIRTITLERLRPEEARALAATIVGSEGGGVDADAIADEASGHPLFIDALIRHRLQLGGASSGPIRLEEALFARIERLDSAARQLLDVVALFGGPLPQDTAASAAALSRDQFNRHLGALRAAHLVRTGGARPTEFVEPFHDRIRETVLSHVSPDERKRWHGRLALALEASTQADAEVLAVHWREAGKADRAMQLYVRAADEAWQALAFDRAARLYGSALELLDEASANTSLKVKLGDALANAGRGADAAASYLAAVPSVNADHALELQLRAADQLLRAGLVDEGMAALEKVMQAAGLRLPKTPRGSLLTLLYRRARVRLRGMRYEEKDVLELPRVALTRIEICWAVGVGLSMIDTIRGAGSQALNVLLSLETGDPFDLARAFALEACFSANGGRSTSRRTAWLVETAETFARRVNRPESLAWATTARGVHAVLEGRFARAAELLPEAAGLFRDQCTGVHREIVSVQRLYATALVMLGRMGELQRTLPVWLREARERGDLFAATNARTGLATTMWLAQDDPNGARAAVREAMEAWSQKGFHLQHYFALQASTLTELYAGNAPEAYRKLRERLPALKRSMLLRIELTNNLVRWHLAATAIAAGATVQARARNRLLREAEQHTRALAKSGAPYAVAMATLCRAGIAAARGDRAGAIDLCGLAARRAELGELGLFAAVARWHLGQLRDGREGAVQLAAAESWMRNEHIKNPGAMARALGPGFELLEPR